MKKINPSDYNLKAKIFWSLMLLGSVAASGLAIYNALSFSAVQLTVVFAALTVSALINQYQFTIPQTRVKIKFQEFIIFWAVIWLGFSAGVLIAAVSSIVGYLAAPQDKKRRTAHIFVNIISAFTAGGVFYATLKYAAGFTERVVAANSVPLVWLAIAVGLMASAHYVLSASLNSLFSRLENASAFAWICRENFLWTSGNYLAGVAATFVFHFAFVKFGLSFGLVVLPATFVWHLAYRIHVARLEQKTKEITEASRVHLATVEALATAIDARDQVGIGHVRRTQTYAVGVGRILGLSDSELQALNTGALLHDIGKLAVPDHILNKPGRLTPAEMEKTKIHAVVGASILEKVNFSYPVLPTVKYHHETWDGKGYPEGLEREKIPLTARILAVADVYDSMRAARPYRPAVSREDARKFLLNGAGSQFDPKVVDVFLRNLLQFETEVDEQGFSYSFDNDSSLQIFSGGDDEQSYVEQIKRANREVFTLYELARVFGASLNLEDTLSLFVKKIGEFVPFDSCVVYLLDEEGEYAPAAYAAGKNSAALGAKRVKPGEGATGFVLKNRQPVHDIDPGMDFKFDQPEFIQEYVGMASLPLIAEEKLVGAVSLYSLEVEIYEEEQMRLLDTVSKIAADAISMALQHAETQSRALTDPMTNLPNARSLQMQFEKEAARAGRKGGGFHLLMLDLDGFKAVNDTFGHKAGDKLLREISRVMRAQLRDYDFLARYAGDEFVVIVPETCDEDIRDLCGRIEKSVREFRLPIDGGGGGEPTKFARVGVSLGAASYPQSGESLDQIIVAADKAMYAVKAARKRAANQLLKPPAPPIIKVEPERELVRDSFILELDESSIISSSAIN